jgi:hypothetical protein
MRLGQGPPLRMMVNKAGTVLNIAMVAEVEPVVLGQKC